MNNSKIKYHKLTIEEVFEKLSSGQDGLSVKRAEELLKEKGPNKIKEREKRGVLAILLTQIANPVIYLLTGAVVVSFIFGDIPEAIAIFIVIALNTIIGFLMEFQAQKSVKALKSLDKLNTSVIRDGNKDNIDAEKLVPGDVVHLEAGDLVPADCRIFSGKELSVDESVLTGESLPVEKNEERIENANSLGEIKNMLFKGTAITNGKAKAIITSTGDETEVGSISELVREEDESKIPLNTKLKKLSEKLIWVTLGLAASYFILGWISGKELYLLLQTSIAWTVAAIPEGLPIVASIALARGMIRLAKRNVIVKHLAAVETLGETTVIFTDKTGTLTENKLSVNRIESTDNTYHFNRSDENDLTNRESAEFKEDKNYSHFLNVSVFCNDAEKSNNNGYKGDPLDVALFGFVEDFDATAIKKIKEVEKLHEDPFDSEAKYMGAIHVHGEDKLYISGKGAAAPVLERSDYYLAEGEQKDITEDIRQKWMEKNDELSDMGLKVIACAYKLADKNQKETLLKEEKFIKNMVFIGFICFLDPARKGITEAIHTCHGAGVKVIMVTGDHAGTAQNIAKQIKLYEGKEIIIAEGGDVEQGKPEINNANLFARVDPKQKHAIVKHFKDRGEITAMTGDGVNDAPALKKADIGIAMGKRGTQIARQVADMVLTDDSFSSIVNAIEEGRIIFGNIRRFIVYQLSYHLAEILIIAGISFSLFSIPLLPLQLLFLNLLSDVFPALALGLGKGDRDTMQQKPKDPSEPIINKKTWKSILSYGIIIAVIITAEYLMSIFYFDYTKEAANTITFFATAFSQLLHVLNMKGPREHIFKNQVIRNRYIWIALLISFSALLAAYVIPVIHDTLSLVYLSDKQWFIVGITSLSTLVVIQVFKRIFRI